MQDWVATVGTLMNLPQSDVTNSTIRRFVSLFLDLIDADPSVPMSWLHKCLNEVVRDYHFHPVFVAAVAC
jgi:hypothetical protein